MSKEDIHAFLEENAPELTIVELEQAHTTDYIAGLWGVSPDQVAKCLTVRVGQEAVVVVTCGGSRLDNRKIKDALGGKGRMLPDEEASALTGHPVGGITPLCLENPLPTYFDVGLNRFDEVVTAAGSTHAAIRIPPDRFAELVNAQWVDVCK